MVIPKFGQSLLHTQQGELECCVRTHVRVPCSGHTSAMPALVPGALSRCDTERDGFLAQAYQCVTNFLDWVQAEGAAGSVLLDPEQSSWPGSFFGGQRPQQAGLASRRRHSKSTEVLPAAIHFWFAC